MQGQSPAFTNYNQSSGLPSNETYFVSQDDDGFVWILTDNGVVKFDGSEGELFNKKSGLADNVNFSVHKDSRDRMWFRSYSGALSYYSKGVFKKYAHNQVIQQLMGKYMIFSLVVDKYDSLHLGLSSGVVMHIDSSGNYRHTQIADRSLIVQQWKGSDPLVVYATNAQSIRHLIINGVRQDMVLKSFPMITGNAIAKTMKNKVVLSIDRYLFELERNIPKLIYKADKPIISLSLDRANKLWIGLQAGGIINYDGNDFKVPSALSFMDKLSITSVMEDNNGRYWITTLEKGAFYFPNLSILSYPFPPNSKLGAVTFGDDAAYLGNYDGSVYKFSLRDKAFQLLKMFQSPVTNLHYLKDEDKLMISSAEDTYLLDLKTELVVPVRKDWKIRGVKKFQEHNGEIIAGNLVGFFRFNSSGVFKTYQKTPIKIRSFYIDDERIFLASVGGLIKTDFSLFRYDSIRALNDNKVLDIRRFGNDILLATSESGLLRLSGDSAVSYYDSDALPCRLIRMIAVAENKLFLATECGLVMGGLKDNRSDNPLKIINDENGLPNSSVDFLGFVRDKLLTFSPDGISIIDTSRLSTETEAKFYLKETLVNKGHIAAIAPALPYHRNSLEFQYGFISYNRNIRVKHRPSPDFEWSEGNVSKVEYFSLSPGDYQPEISYSVNGGAWTVVKLSNPFTIKLPWWETIYFQLLLILLIASMIGLYFYAAYHKRITSIKIQENLRYEKDRISQELHDNIGSKLAYIKFSLSSLNNAIEFLDKKTKIELEIGSAVDELRDTIWAINKEEVSVMDFVNRVRLMLSRIDLHGRLIEFAFVNTAANLDPNLDPGVAVELFRIIQEAVNNSIKHSGGNKIAVELSLQSKNNLFVTIQDNGIGFDMGSQIGNDGYGLRSMKRRAEKLGAEFRLNSSSDEGTAIKVVYRFSA
jgi:two-component sensor histidine kinase